MGADDSRPPDVPPLSRAVLTGCLLGAALAASWAVFGLAIYALAMALGASLGLGVLLSGLGGPLIGSVLVVAWWVRRHPTSRDGGAQRPPPVNG